MLIEVSFEPCEKCAGTGATEPDGRECIECSGLGTTDEWTDF